MWEDIPSKLLTKHNFTESIEGLFIEINLKKTKLLFFGGYRSDHWGQAERPWELRLTQVSRQKIKHAPGFIPTFPVSPFLPVSPSFCPRVSPIDLHHGSPHFGGPFPLLIFEAPTLPSLGYSDTPTQAQVTTVTQILPHIKCSVHSQECFHDSVITRPLRPMMCKPVGHCIINEIRRILNYLRDAHMYI